MSLPIHQPAPCSPSPMSEKLEAIAKQVQEIAEMVKRQERVKPSGARFLGIKAASQAPSARR